MTDTPLSAPTHPLLLLWDIDGTLMSSDGAGREALRQGLLNRFGVLDDLEDLDLAGRTDTSIGEEIARKHAAHGVTSPDLLEAYLERLPVLLTQRRGRLCPGVREMLEWTHAHPEIHNALLTGNVERGAFLKLRHFGLDCFFEFGAFGDDSSDRNQLGPIALERARTRLKKDFHLQHTWVIGDTPRDIACARALGCRVLAVATGGSSAEELRAAGADLIAPDLSDHPVLIARMLAERGARKLS